MHSPYHADGSNLQSFILSHLALSGIPMGLFVIMTITVVVFSIIAALVLAVLAAVIFSVVCVGFALIILLPTLFITTAAASFIWLWGVGAYYLLKWFNKKEIPGIHKPMGDGIGSELGLDALTGGETPPQPEKANGHAANGSANGNANGSAHGRTNGQAKEGRKDGSTGKVDGVIGKVPGGHKAPKLDGVGKSTGLDVNNPDPKKGAELGKNLAGKTGVVG